MTDKGFVSGGADKQLLFHSHQDQSSIEKIAQFSESIFSIEVIDEHIWVGSFSGHCYQIHLSSQVVRKWQAHEGPVFALTSLNNGWMASGGGDGRLQIWDVASQKIIRTIWLGEFKIRSLQFVAEECQLMVTGGDGSLTILDIPWFNTQHHWTLKDNPCYSSAYLQHKDVWISGHKNGNILFWQRNDTQPLVQIQGHAGAIYDVKLDKKNRVLYTCSQDKTLKIWRLSDLTLLSKWEFWGKLPYRSINKIHILEDKIFLLGDNSKIDVLKICFFD
jgi:WD40 repeat protein